MIIQPFKPAQQPAVPENKFDKFEAARTGEGKYVERDTDKDGLTDVIFGSNSIGYRYDRYYTYDEAGNVTSIIHDFYDDGNADAYYEYEYDDGKLAKERQTFYNLKGEVSSANEIEYGDDYRIERLHHHDGNGNPGYTEIKYDKDGKVVSIINDYDCDGVVDEMDEYENGKLAKTSLNNYGDDEFDVVYSYTYDNEGNKHTDKIQDTRPWWVQWFN